MLNKLGLQPLKWPSKVVQSDQLITKESVENALRVLLSVSGQPMQSFT